MLVRNVRREWLLAGAAPRASTRPCAGARAHTYARLTSTQKNPAARPIARAQQPSINGPHVDESIRREMHEEGRDATRGANGLAASFVEDWPSFLEFNGCRATPGAALAAFLFTHRARWRKARRTRCECKACGGRGGGSGSTSAQGPRASGGGRRGGSGRHGGVGRAAAVLDQTLAQLASAGQPRGAPAAGRGAAAAAPPAGAEQQAGAGSTGVPRACSVCGKEESPGVRLMVCSRCRRPGVRYCSQACQRADWGAHKAGCRPAAE